MPASKPKHARHKLALFLSVVVFCVSAGAHAHAPVRHKQPITPHYNTQVDCLAQAIYFEGRNQSLQTQMRIGQVVLNRVMDKRSKFPDTVCEVVRQGEASQACQFSWVCAPHSIKNWAVWEKTKGIAEALYQYYYLVHAIPDFTRRSEYFVNRGVTKPWMKHMTKHYDGDLVFLASD